jgi:hypothetical protein
MSLLIYSPKCEHSKQILALVQKHKQLQQLVKFHNINTQGLPAHFRQKVTHVPTMFTQNGKILVGSEIRAWLTSLLPSPEVTQCDFGTCAMSTLDGEGVNDDIFDLDSYGQALQPVITPELQQKITQQVKDTPYQDNV